MLRPSGGGVAKELNKAKGKPFRPFVCVVVVKKGLFQGFQANRMRVAAPID